MSNITIAGSTPVVEEARAAVFYDSYLLKRIFLELPIEGRPMSLSAQLYPLRTECGSVCHGKMANIKISDISAHQSIQTAVQALLAAIKDVASL